MAILAAYVDGCYARPRDSPSGRAPLTRTLRTAGTIVIAKTGTTELAIIRDECPSASTRRSSSRPGPGVVVIQALGEYAHLKTSRRSDRIKVNVFARITGGEAMATP